MPYFKITPTLKTFYVLATDEEQAREYSISQFERWFKEAGSVFEIEQIQYRPNHYEEAFN